MNSTRCEKWGTGYSDHRPLVYIGHRLQVAPLSCSMFAPGSQAPSCVMGEAKNLKSYGFPRPVLFNRGSFVSRNIWQYLETLLIVTTRSGWRLLELSEKMPGMLLNIHNARMHNYPPPKNYPPKIVIVMRLRNSTLGQ